MLGLFAVLFGPTQGIAQSNGADNQQRVDALADLVAKPIYDLDREQIQAIVESFVSQNTDITGIHIVESLEDETMLSFYQASDGGAVFGEPLPADLLAMPVLVSDIVYREEQVGLLSVYVADQQSLGLTPVERAWIAQNPEISVGVEEWYPFIRVDPNGKVGGIAGDFLEIIFARTGLKARVVPDIWANLISDFEQGTIDLLPATYYTEERTGFGLYSAPYFSGREFLYVRDDRQDITSFEDLRGKKLAIPRGFGTIPKIQQRFPEIELVLTDSILESVYTVLNGEADATFELQIVMEQLLLSELITGIKPIPQTVFEASDLFLFSNIDKPILHQILSKALDSITVEERQQILSKWLASGAVAAALDPEDLVSPEEQGVPILLQMAVISLLLLLGLFIAIYVLGRIGRRSNLSELFGSRAFRVGVLIGLSVLV
ncbi:MAG: transporter substrate-binding domain-containing protein, partial [Rhodospirillaceae bacterium]